MRILASLMSILYIITFIVWLSLSLNGRRYSEAGLGVVLMVLSAIIYGSIFSGINNAITHDQMERMLYRLENFIHNEEYEEAIKLIQYYKDSRELTPLSKIGNTLEKSRNQLMEGNVENCNRRGAITKE